MRGRRTALILFVGALVLVPCSSAFASSPKQPTTNPGNIGIRLVPVPGAPATDPLANSYVIDRLAPGTTLVRSVQIDNDTDAAVDVSVYPAAARIVGRNFAFASGHNANDLSNWTAVSSGVLRLAPGAEAVDSLTITVPPTAPSGERYAVLWAGVSSRPTDGGGITLVNRVGVRMYISIGPGGAPAPNFTLGSLSARRSPTGEKLVVAYVHNSGRSILDLSGNLMLSDGPGGLRAGPFAARAASPLSPGRSELVKVGLAHELPRGPWHAEVTLKSGSLQHSTTATISFPANQGVKGTGSVVVFILAGALACIVIAAVAFFATRHRRPRGRHQRPVHRNPVSSHVQETAGLRVERPVGQRSARPS